MSALLFAAALAASPVQANVAPATVYPVATIEMTAEYRKKRKYRGPRGNAYGHRYRAPRTVYVQPVYRGYRSRQVYYAPPRYRNYQPRRMYRNDYAWRGDDGRYYCRRSDGTTGLIIGGAVGALIGRSLDDGRDRTLGTIIGAGAGALLGRSIDRGEMRCN